MSKKVIDLIKKTFPQFIIAVSDFRGDDTLLVDKTGIVQIAQFLKNDSAMKFDLPIDVTGVDYLTYKSERIGTHRFEVVYHLYSTEHKHRIRLKVLLDNNEPESYSLTCVWKGVNWFERETFDMFGIKFINHPDLRRILLYPEFKGHPLRKDYPVRGYQPLLPMPNLKGDPLPWEQKHDIEDE